MLGPVLSSVYINDLNRGLKCTLSKVADYTKIGVVDSLMLRNQHPLQQGTVHFIY